MCVSHFNKQKDLDDHISKYHTFVCKICRHITKTLAELDYHMDIKHDSTPEKLPARSQEDEQMVQDSKHERMVEDQREALQRWRDIKDMKAKRRLSRLLGSMDSSEVARCREGERSEEEKGPDQRRSWSSSRWWQGPGSRLHSVWRRQQSGPTLQTFQKGTQKSGQGRRQINWKLIYVFLFFQH